MKKLLFVALFFCGVAQAQVPISALPAASPLAGSELVPIVQGGVTRASTAAAVQTFMEGLNNSWTGTNTFNGPTGVTGMIVQSADTGVGYHHATMMINSPSIVGEPGAWAFNNIDNVYQGFLVENSSNTANAVALMELANNFISHELTFFLTSESYNANNVFNNWSSPAAGMDSRSLPLVLGSGLWASFEIDPTGHSTILTPASNASPALTINSVAGSSIVKVNSLNTANSDIQVARAGSNGTANTLLAGANINLAGASNSTTVQNSGGQTEFWAFDGSANHQLGYWTASRGFILNAPSSGVAATINGVAGGNSLTVLPATTASGVSDIQVTRPTTGTANTYLGGSNVILTDAGATSSVFQHSGGQTEIWAFNGSPHQLAFWNTNNGLTLPAATAGATLSVAGSLQAGAAVDITPQTGTFTGTFTGLTTTVTATFEYFIVGKHCDIALISTVAVSGTSNSTSFTITGIPSAINPVNTLHVTSPALIDNGVASIMGGATIASVGTLFLTKMNPATGQFSSTGWTASGTKGLAPGFNVSFLIP